MKKLSFIFIFAFVLIVAQSCFKKHYEIKDIRFSLAKINENDQMICTSTVDSRLIFVISYYEEMVAQKISKTMGGVCYATTVGKIIDNPLVEKTFSLKFNKPFLYNGRTVSSGTDLFSLDEISPEIKTYETQKVFCSMRADKVLEFSEKFSENAVFEKGEYEVVFSCKTSDDRIFLKTINIVFE